ncbi:hypothetical protein CYY_002838 [Polysphondylium violaceum]|uniref:Ankyrin repeat-containing protein n=1 Tax=Polysphondylium violaceum TaxID=133409 RepID=A0A8J4Q0L8_9MYCE|nr:hypothetical protein CYY_002838 [Polysphondylium violaceum]
MTLNTTTTTNNIITCLFKVILHNNYIFNNVKYYLSFDCNTFSKSYKYIVSVKWLIANHHYKLLKYKLLANDLYLQFDLESYEPLTYLDLDIFILLYNRFKDEINVSVIGSMWKLEWIDYLSTRGFQFDIDKILLKACQFGDYNRVYRFLNSNSSIEIDRSCYSLSIQSNNIDLVYFLFNDDRSKSNSINSKKKQSKKRSIQFSTEEGEGFLFDSVVVENIEIFVFIQQYCKRFIKGFKFTKTLLGRLYLSILLQSSFPLIKYFINTFDLSFTLKENVNAIDYPPIAALALGRVDVVKHVFEKKLINKYHIEKIATMVLDLGHIELYHTMTKKKPLADVEYAYCNFIDMALLEIQHLLSTYNIKVQVQNLLETKDIDVFKYLFQRVDRTEINKRIKELIFHCIEDMDLFVYLNQQVNLAPFPIIWESTTNIEILRLLEYKSKESWLDYIKSAICFSIRDCSQSTLLFRFLLSKYLRITNSSSMFDDDGEFSETLFVSAVDNGRNQVIQILLAKGLVPLHISEMVSRALDIGKLSIALLLIDHFKSINFKPSTNLLENVILNGHVQCLEYLLEKYYPNDYNPPKNIISALESSSTAMIQFLVNNPKVKEMSFIFSLVNSLNKK